MSAFFKILAISVLGGTASGSYVLSTMELPPPEQPKNQKRQTPKAPRDPKILPEINL